MKNVLKLSLYVFATLIGMSFSELRAGISPYSVNDPLVQGIDPNLGTASGDQLAREILETENFEDLAGEFVRPAWLETLALISPANYPITTFLTNKSLQGIRDYMAATDELKYEKGQRMNMKTVSPKSAFEVEGTEKAGKMIDNYRLNWGEIAVLPFQDTVTLAYTATASPTATLTVANPKMWKKGHELKVQLQEDVNSNGLVLYVNSVDVSASTIDVQTITNGGSTDPVPDIPLERQLTRLGSAFNEIDMKAVAIMQVPFSSFNFAQKFITSVVFSDWQKRLGLFVNYSLSMVTSLAMQDFRYGQEMSFMFGNRAEFDDEDGRRIFATGGLDFYIDQEITYGQDTADLSITETDIVDFMKQMRVGNNGSDTRQLYSGSDLISELNKGVMSDSTRFVEREYETVYGLSFTRLYCFFGSIKVTYAPLMDQADFRDQGFLLDPEFIDKFAFQPFEEQTTDLKKIRDIDAKATDMQETCGLVVRNLDTHFKFTPTSVTP